MNRIWVVVVALAFGCGGAPEAPVANLSESSQQGMSGPLPKLGVMTQNLYLGASLDPLLQATLDTLPAAATQVLAQVEATNYPERAQRIADEIAATHPNVIGLQEVELITIQPPVGPSQTLDYLAILQAALLQRGLTYNAVAVFDGTNLQATTSTGLSVSVLDREALLADSSVTTWNAQAHAFAVNATVTIGGTGGVPVTLKRGWVEADASYQGIPFHVASTHLEAVEVPQLAIVQLGQAAQLVIDLAKQPLSVVLVGDFNSAADNSTTPTYAFMRSAGYFDIWKLANWGDPGFTCCQAPDLLNPDSLLSQRIDYVFWRPGLFGLQVALRQVDAELVGADPSSKTISGLWPSDHAGVVADLPARK